MEETIRLKVVLKEIDILMAIIDNKVIEGENRNPNLDSPIFGAVNALKDMKTNLIVLKEKIKDHAKIEAK